MISCKRATELMSKAQEEPLTLTESLGLKLHLFICECCAQFERQLALFRSVFRAKGTEGRDEPDDESCPALSPETRNRILKQLVRPSRQNNPE